MLSLQGRSLLQKDLLFSSSSHLALSCCLKFLFFDPFYDLESICRLLEVCQLFSDAVYLSLLRCRSIPFDLQYPWRIALPSEPRPLLSMTVVMTMLKLFWLQWVASTRIFYHSNARQSKCNMGKRTFAIKFLILQALDQGKSQREDAQLLSTLLKHVFPKWRRIELTFNGI